MKPSWAKATRSVLNRFTPLVAIVILAQFWLAGTPGPRDVAFDALIAGLVAAVLIGDWAYRMSTVLTLDSQRLVIRSLLVLRRTIPRHAIGGMALRAISYYPSRRSLAVIYDNKRARVATLPEGIWRDEDLNRLKAALGSPESSYKQVTPGQFRSEFGGNDIPQYIGWVLAAIVLALVLFAPGRY